MFVALVAPPVPLVGEHLSLPTGINIGAVLYVSGCMIPHCLALHGRFTPPLIRSEELKGVFATDSIQTPVPELLQMNQGLRIPGFTFRLPSSFKNSFSQSFSQQTVLRVRRRTLPSTKQRKREWDGPAPSAADQPLILCHANFVMQ